MPKTLRVGIIGTGYAGWCHAKAFSRLPDVVVTALWNRTFSRAERLASALARPDMLRFSRIGGDLIQQWGCRHH